MFNSLFRGTSFARRAHAKPEGELPKARYARYMAKATAAEMNAATAETPETKKTWLDVAAAWRALADTNASPKGHR
jgi:hypothetical protein